MSVPAPQQRSCRARLLACMHKHVTGVQPSQQCMLSALCTACIHSAAPRTPGPPTSWPQAYPLDLVRTRLAAQTRGAYYHGITHTLRTIVADEGAAGLYRGLGATLLQVRAALWPPALALCLSQPSWLAVIESHQQR